MVESTFMNFVISYSVPNDDVRDAFALVSFRAGGGVNMLNLHY